VTDIPLHDLEGGSQSRGDRALIECRGGDREHGREQINGAHLAVHVSTIDVRQFARILAGLESDGLRVTKASRLDETIDCKLPIAQLPAVAKISPMVTIKPLVKLHLRWERRSGRMEGKKEMLLILVLSVGLALTARRANQQGAAIAKITRLGDIVGYWYQRLGGAKP
jgi:hypothetical protein